MTPQEAEHILKKACLITTPDVEPSDLEEHFKYAKDQHGRSEFTYDDCIKAIQLAAERGNEWIRASERLPKPNYRIFVIEIGGRHNVSTYRKGNPQSEKYWMEKVEFWLDKIQTTKQ